MAINKIRTLVDECYEGGKNTISSFRKVPAIASVAGSVVDLSMSPGNPRPNYYTGDALTSTALNPAYGIWHGGNVSPATKVLRTVTTMALNTAFAPLELYTLDYLMFYPLIDMDSTDEQFLVNWGVTSTATTDPSAAKLTRYINGEGVRAFLVATNPYIGGAVFTMKYTNQEGVSKNTPLITTNTNTFIGTVVHSGVTAGVSGTFINVPDGDGIRSVESITFMAPNGGLAALVLCKVIGSTYTKEITAPAEWDLLTMKGTLPIIQDGAYLNFIGQVNGSVTGQLLMGTVETVWN